MAIHYCPENSVLMESDNGATASAMIFNMAEIAKANRINTDDYFEPPPSEIPKHQNDTDLKFLDDLLSWPRKV